jgi:protocatechuate 3,4-dioxygenase beta subunit
MKTPVLLILSVVICGCGVDTCREEPALSLVGRVQDGDDNPVAGVKVYGYADVPEGVRPEPSCSTLTDCAGRYSLTFDCNVRELIVVPSREGCVFSPRNRLWRPESQLDGYDFRIYCGESYLVDGHVWGYDGAGQPLPGVCMSIRSSDGSHLDHTATDESGYYVFQDLYPNFDYRISPCGFCPEFDPPSRTIEHPAEDYHDQDFTAVTPAFVYISGRVRDPYGAPLEGVTIEFYYRTPTAGGALDPDPHAQFEVHTDADGWYRIHTMSCVYIEVRPSEPGCRAVPNMRSYTPSTDIAREDYTLICGGSPVIGDDR